MVKSFISVVIFILGWNVLIAQQSLNLQINHKWQDKSIAIEGYYDNDGQNKYQLARLQYYITDFSLKMKDGSLTYIDESFVLVDATSNATYKIGNIQNVDMSSVDSIIFHLGVNEDLNHADPSEYKDDHPLSLQSPSMHWGWAGGYRFLAFEGYTPNAAGSFTEKFEIHTVGDANYRRIAVPIKKTSADGNEIMIYLNADYMEMVGGITLAGTFSHSEKYEAKTAAENMSSKVFTAAESTSSSEQITLNSLTLSPNPSMAFFNISHEADIKYVNIKIYNQAGILVFDKALSTSNGLTRVDHNLVAGLYSVMMEDDMQKKYATKLVIISE